MIHTLNRPNRRYRQLSKVIGYRLPTYRLTSKAIGPNLNAELKDMQAARRARQTEVSA